jgi:integrase
MLLLVSLPNDVLTATSVRSPAYPSLCSIRPSSSRHLRSTPRSLLPHQLGRCTAKMLTWMCKPLSDIKKFWKSLCRTAGLEKLRLHDLRHSYASNLVSQGFSLHIVGRLLGHTQPQTTARYAHLDDASLRQATEGFSARLSPVSKVSRRRFPAAKRS